MSLYDRFPPLEITRRILQDRLFRDSGILVTATVVSGGMNYLYQIAMGRLLGPEQYGVFGALFGLTYLIGVLSQGTKFCSTRYIAKHAGESTGFLKGFSLRVGGAIIMIFAFLALLSPHLASFLKVDDTTLLLMVIGGALLGPLRSAHKGAIEGMQRFTVSGGLGIAAAGIKLLLGVGLVLFGYGIYGALGAPILAGTIILLAGAYYLRDHYLSDNGYETYSDVYRYAAPSVLAGFAMAVPANLDVIMVKHLFSSVDAGLYTAATVMGKVLLFLPMGISGAMFPKVSENHANGNGTHSLLQRTLLYTAGIMIVAVGTYALFARHILGLLFGAEYVSIASIVPWYGLMIAVFSVAAVFLKYALARNETAYIKLFAALTVLEIPAIYLYASTMLEIVQVMLAFNATLAALGAVIHFTSIGGGIR